MDGLKNIDFKLEKEETAEDANTENKDFSKRRPAFGFNFRNFIKSRKSQALLIFVVFLVLFGIFGVYFPATRVYNAAKLTYRDAQAAAYAIKTQNVSLASDQLEKTKTNLTRNIRYR